MDRLTVVACTTVLLLYNIKGFSCDNTTLLIPASKYGSTPDESPYGARSPSKIASLSFIGPVPPCPPPATDILINVISTSPYLLSSLPPSLIYNFLNVLTSSPLYLESVEPSIIINLIDTLCSSSSLLKDTPDRTLVSFITAIVLCPKIVDRLPPSLTFCLLSKIYAKDLLCSLSPAVRVTLLHSLSSPIALNALKPIEISFLINIYQSTKCALLELSPIDLIELLKTISSLPTLKDNVPTSQIICFLHKISQLVPSLVSTIPPNITNALLAPITKSIHKQFPTTLVQLTTVITSSPYMFSTIDPLILSSLLFTLSQPNILSTVPSTVVVKLLTDLSLSNAILKSIKPEAIVNILYAIKSISPNLLFDVSPSVRFIFVSYMTDIKVIGSLSVQTNIKLIDTLCNNQYFLPLLPSNSINQIINVMVSNESLLNAVPLNIIVDFVYNTTILSPILLRETSLDVIQKLFLPLTTMSALSSLSLFSYTKLLYSLAYTPLLMNSISDIQITNILNALNLCPNTLKEIPNDVYINILTQIFTKSELLSKIPFTLLLNFLQKINHSTPKTILYEISPSAISTFMDFLEKKPAILISLSPKDMIILIDILTKFPSFLTQISAKTLNVLFDSITASSTILDAIPTEIKIKLILNIHLLCPAVFYSLSPKPIREMTNSFNSFETLSSLSPNSLIELTTVISECPCLLSALDYKTVTNLLDVLSTLPSTLNLLKLRVITNLITSISSSDALSTTIPIYSYIRFWQALSISCSLPPPSVCAILLNPLKSLNVVTNLTTAQFEIVVDTLATTPRLLTEIQQTIFINLLTAIPLTFINLPYIKIIALLTSIHSISPSLLCVVPEIVLTDLLKMLNSQSELNSLPSEYILALITVLSSSPCLLNTMPASTLDRVLRLFSSSPKSPIPFSVLENFLIKLSLTSPILKDLKFPLIIEALSTLSKTSSVCALSPSVTRVLLVSSGDAKTIFELRPSEIVLFMGLATSTPSLLNALAGPTLNNLLAKVASSPHLVTYVSPSLITSFIYALTSTPAAFNTVQSTTVVNLMTTIALHQPSILSKLSSPVSSLLQSTFNCPQAFTLLPPPAINNLVNLLSTFPNLLTALPVSTINSMLSFLSTSPTVLGILPTCTLVKFLTVLTSIPPLIRAVSPCLLTSFLSALSTTSPKFLCILPPPVVTTIISTVISEQALASATPSSIAALILTLNRSSCLIPVLPLPILISFLKYLPSHPNLLGGTPGPELLALINNVQSPGSIQRVVPNGVICASNRFDDFTSFNIHSPELSAIGDPNATNTSTTTTPKVLRPTDTDGTTIYAFPGDNDQYNSSENIFGSFEHAIDLIPKLILPDNFKGADVYILPSNNNQSTSSFSNS